MWKTVNFLHPMSKIGRTVRYCFPSLACYKTESGQSRGYIYTATMIWVTFSKHLTPFLLFWPSCIFPFFFAEHHGNRRLQMYTCAKKTNLLWKWPTFDIVTGKYGVVWGGTDYFQGHEVVFLAFTVDFFHLLQFCGNLTFTDGHTHLLANFL